MLCSNCGIYGHRHELCPQGKKQQEAAESSKIAGDNSVNNTGNVQPNRDSSGDYWKVVQKYRRPHKAKEKQSNLHPDQPSEQPAGSRFSLLAIQLVGTSNPLTVCRMKFLPKPQRSYYRLRRHVKCRIVASGKKQGTDNVARILVWTREKKVVENQEKHPLGIRRVDKRARHIVGDNSIEISGQVALNGGDVVMDAPMDATVMGTNSEEAHQKHCLGSEAHPYDPGDGEAIPPDSGQIMNGLEIESPIVSSSITSPWCVLGDFNDIRTSSERIGGRNVNPVRLQWFQNRINDAELIDLGSCGPNMTWRGPRLEGGSRIYEHLDRGLVNSHFLQAMRNHSSRYCQELLSLITMLYCYM
ncbi:hypothetical protein K1719_046539 [Acacia pycnantha]|nr:hypothetical protein K1719_046539 [Acacia pycnantha]